jgi:hypothetical protein
MLQANILLLNADPVFVTDTWEVLDLEEGFSTRVVRKREEMASLAMMQQFDALIFDDDTERNLDTALAFHRHFPTSRKIVILRPEVSARRETEAVEAGLQLVRFSGFRSIFARRLRGAVNTAVSHSSRGLSEAESAATDIGYALAGDLAVFQAPETLQLVCMSGRSGRFTFIGRQGRAEVYIHEGHLRHAEMPDQQGEGVISRIFGWGSGRFIYEDGSLTEQQTIDRSWQHVIVDSLKVRDEAETLLQDETVTDISESITTKSRDPGGKS